MTVYAWDHVVLLQVAGLEYDPAEYHRLIQPIVEGQADVGSKGGRRRRIRRRR